LASGTRGVWIALFLSLGLWVLLFRAWRVFGIFLAAAVTAALIVFLSPSVRGRAASIVDTKVNQSNLIRMGLYAESLQLMKNHPVMGIGPGNVFIRPEELRWGGSPPHMNWTEVHNMYLQIGVERGLIGLAVFLWLLTSIGRLAWRAARSDPSTKGIFFAFVGLLLAGMTETWINDSEVVMCFTFLVGTAWALGFRAVPAPISDNNENKKARWRA
jgi:putative inorganic carbon (HCO3(-)) transporter